MKNSKQKLISNFDINSILILLFCFVILSKTILGEYQNILILFIVTLSLIIFIFKNRGNIKVYITQLYLIFFIMVISSMILISFFYVSDTDLTINYLSSYFVGILISIFFITLLNNKYYLKRFSFLYILICFLISIYTIYHHVLFLVLGIDSEYITITGGQIFGRGLGFIGNPNYYSLTLLLGLSFILGWKYFNEMNNKLINLILIVISIDLILTFSRGALFSYIVIIAVWMFLKLLDRQKINRGSLIKIFINSFVLLFIVIIIIRLNSFQTVLNQITGRVNDLFVGDGSGRYGLWLEGYQVWLTNLQTTILGIGGNHFDLYSTLGVSVHNGYLRYLYELGIVGLITLLLFLIVLFIYSFSIRQIKPKSPFFFSWLGILIFSFSNDTFHLNEFWLTAMCILTYKVLNSRKTET